MIFHDKLITNFYKGKIEYFRKAYNKTLGYINPEDPKAGPGVSPVFLRARKTLKCAGHTVLQDQGLEPVH